MDDLELCLYDLEILQNHHLCAFVANLKIDAIYALYPESFCDKNPAFGKFSLFVTLKKLISARVRHIPKKSEDLISREQMARPEGSVVKQMEKTNAQP